MCILKFVLFFNLSTFAGVNQFNNQRLENEILSLPQGSKLKVALQSISQNCSSTKNLVSIRVAKNQNNAGGYFDYYYEHQVIDSALPTIIYLPGGPGGFSIGASLNVGTANIIKIDPRGTGCNFDNGKYFSSAEVSTDNAADDILEVVKKEKLNRVILYGQSYGTILATVVAFKMELQKKSPELVILEGTAGKAWTDWGSYLNGFVSTGNYFLDQNLDLKNLFNKTTLPLDLPPEFWAWRLSMSGNAWRSEIAELKSISDPNSIDYETAKQDVLYNYEYYKNNRSPDLTQNPSFFVTQSVLCSELSKTYNNAWAINLVQSNLVLDQNALNQSVDYCKKGVVFKPYDSHKLPLTSPVVYFQGETDPQTPLYSALYHFNGQSNKKNKYFYKTVYGGHSPLQADLSVCSSEIWKKLISNSYDLTDVLDSSGHCL